MYVPTHVYMQAEVLTKTKITTTAFQLQFNCIT